jgi:putative Ca2+/H+ antiporter (TMEM165/GDT1 family)
MDLKTTIAIFGTVFLAELGDKTQLATVLFASNRQNTPLAVFVAAAAALVASTAIAVAAGSTLSNYVNTRHLSILAGAGFIVIGAWTLWSALRAG